MMKTCLISIIALCVSASLSANEIRKKEFDRDDNRIVLPHVEASFAYHATAAATWYMDTLHGARVPYATFNEFARRMVSNAYASFEYTYTEEGRERTRVYYASSGLDEPHLGLRDWRNARPYEEFLPKSGIEVHAKAMHGEPSVFTPSPRSGEDTAGRNPHMNDAELKAVRTLSRDIDAGRVAPMGKLVGFITMPMCDSCEKIIKDFSDQYGVDVSVNYLKARGGRASSQFMRRRWAYFDTMKYDVVRRNDIHDRRPPGGAGGSCSATIH